MEVTESSTESAHDYGCLQSAFCLFDNFELGVGPNLAIVPEALCAQAAQARHGRGLLSELLEAYPSQRCRVGCDGKQRQRSQKQNPKKSASLDVTHFIAPPARRSRQSCPDLW